MSLCSCGALPARPHTTVDRISRLSTEEVIERVSNLFVGCPKLIEGFNTFLPPGYRIEFSLDEHQQNVVRTTSPTGTSTYNLRL